MADNKMEPFEVACRAIVRHQAERLPPHLRQQFVDDHWRLVLPAVELGCAEFMERQNAR
jgi:hypothetical protein